MAVNTASRLNGIDVVVLMSPLVTQVLLTIGWSFISVLLILGGTWLFDRLTPIDYRAEVRKGNVAAGLVVAAVVLSITAIVVTVVLT
jgi:uncharacterized membrane protein YjfL (UPF0719 family)